jgi:hypothetical protein
MMISHTGKTPRNDGRREQHIRALGAVLNALVSQSRALTAQAAVTFHAELQPAAFHIALWLNAFGPGKPSAVAQAVGMDRSAASRLTRELVVLSQTVAVIRAENQVIEEIQYLARGGPDESRSGWR